MNKDFIGFYEQLENHDWFYMMSDDHRVWLAGNKDFEEIKSLAEQKGGIFLKLFEDYRHHIFNGEAYMTQKPERPKITDYI